METTKQTFAQVAAMPAATWHFLKMNDAELDIPDGLVIEPRVEVEMTRGARGALDEFEEAFAEAQEAWERDHPEPSAEERAERAAAMAAEADATYGGTAQSVYQATADAIEEARSLSLAFDSGMGDEVAAYLRFAAGNRVVVRADDGQTVDARVVVSSGEGVLSVGASIVVAGKNSSIALSLVVDSPAEGLADEASGAPLRAPSGCRGIVGTTVRVFADEGSRVDIARIQTLDEGFADVDDMGVFVAARARVAVRQTVLGASRAYTGLAADLRGSSGGLGVDTRYLGRGTQVRDFNYIVRHHGERTESNLIANGVLAGASAKTLRGTIDLIRGCKGAQGSENETVLLVDDGVHNKTVPTILCNEDDVAGNHGATIGHIRDEQLFYLASRGLSQGDAENMFVGAMVEQAALDASDDAARAAVLAFGERTMPGFARVFDE